MINQEMVEELVSMTVSPAYAVFLKAVLIALFYMDQLRETLRPQRVTSTLPSF